MSGVYLKPKWRVTDDIILSRTVIWWGGEDSTVKTLDMFSVLKRMTLNNKHIPFTCKEVCKWW